MRISDWSSDVCSSDLIIDVVPGPVGERTRLAPTGHSPVDKRRVARERYLGAETEPLHDPGTKTLDQDVGALGEHQAGLDRRRILEVERQMAAPAMGHGVGSRRSEEGRGGKECVSTCRSRGSPYH